MVPPSELAAQNDLFATAMAAKQRGQVAPALQSLERLIARFPTGPLADAACAERMRLRQRAGDLAGSRRDARQYLADFPDGLAVSEARLILGIGEGMH